MADQPVFYLDSGDLTYLESIAFTVTPTTGLADLSTVTSATIEVTSKNGAVPASAIVWTGSLRNQTASTLTVSHQFVAGDRDVRGTYTFLVRLYVSSNLVRCVPVNGRCV